MYFSVYDKSGFLSAILENGRHVGFLQLIHIWIVATSSTCGVCISYIIEIDSKIIEIY